MNRDDDLGMYRIRVMNRNSVLSDVVSQLLNYLVSNRIGPGDKLPSERALSERMGLGRSSIREAVKSLHVLGLVDVKQGDGTYLRSTESAVLPMVLEWGLLLSRPGTTDLIEARHHLEVFVARKAAERLTPAARPVLAACLDRMEKAEASGHAEEFVEADIEFHFRLAELAGNAVIADMLRGIRVLLHVWMTRLVTTDGMAGLSRMHRRLANAVTSGDPDKAEKVMRAHIESAGERLLCMLPPPPAEPAAPASASVTAPAELAAKPRQRRPR